MRRQTLNVCQAGHETHETKTVQTDEGPMVVYDWERYMGFAGYCPGQDDVSMSLDLYGTWEETDFVKAMSVIRPGDVVWDFGSHIGWYSMGAEKRGGRVWAVDADPENMWLLEANTNHAYSVLNWVADIWTESWALDDVRLIKSDVEGAEDEVFRICRRVLEGRRVDYLLLECSPEFDTYYPAMIDEIRGYGYAAWFDGKQITGVDLGDTQKNIWFQCQ